MRISYACEASPDVVANEDFVLASERFVLVLDGATDSGLPNGCVHDVAWLARRLGGQLAAALIERPGLPLPGPAAPGCRAAGASPSRSGRPAARRRR